MAMSLQVRIVLLRWLQVWGVPYVVTEVFVGQDHSGVRVLDLRGESLDATVSQHAPKICPLLILCDLCEGLYTWAAKKGRLLAYLLTVDIH